MRLFAPGQQVSFHARTGEVCRTIGSRMNQAQRIVSIHCGNCDVHSSDRFFCVLFLSSLLTHVCVISCGKSNQYSTVLFQPSMLVYVLSKRQTGFHWICSILNRICMQTDYSIHSIRCPDSLHVNKDNCISAAVLDIESRKDSYGV